MLGFYDRLRALNYQGTFYDKFPKIYNVYVIAAIATVSGLMFGFDISSVSSFVGQKHYKNFFDYPNSITQGGITASMAGGSFLGSLASSSISDIFGRRFTMTFSATFWIIGAMVQSSSQNRAQLICGRLISGVGIGFGSSIAPVYCSEVSPARMRGMIAGIFQFSVTVGIMVMFYIGYGCSFIDGVGSFRVAWAIQIIPGLILLIGVFFLPESPRWLANHGRWDEAEFVVAQVTANGDKNDKDVLIQLEEIKEQVLIDQDAKSFGYIDLFKHGNLNRTMVGIWAQIWQQLCGMNVMMYYIVYVFDMAGYTGNTNLVSSSIQYVINVVMTIPALFLMDRVGRRPLLLIGGVLMMTWLFAQAGLLAVYSVPTDGFDGDSTVRITIPKANKPAAKAVIACSYLFVASFAPTWGIGIWVYCAEIFPNTQRAKGSALSAAFNWIFNFALAMFVPTAFKNITWKTYIIFGVFCVVLTIHVYFLFPETKGKTLEEIDKMWADKVPAWRSSSWVPELPVLGEKKELETEHHEDGASVTPATSAEATA